MDNDGFPWKTDAGFVPFIRSVSLKWSVPVWVYLSVALVETGMGRRTKGANNWTGITENGKPVNCGTVPASFDALGFLLARKEPWNGMLHRLNESGDAEAFIREFSLLYSDDPDYASKLKTTIERHNLKEY